MAMTSKKCGAGDVKGALAGMQRHLTAERAILEVTLQAVKQHVNNFPLAFPFSSR